VKAGETAVDIGGSAMGAEAAVLEMKEEVRQKPTGAAEPAN